MSRLAVVERTKLNLAEVTVLLSGENKLETDVISQMFVGFGARKLLRSEALSTLRDLIQAEPVDLLVIDAIGGLAEIVSIVRDVRRLGTETRYTPVVLATSNVRPSMVKAARDSGISYVVAKPIMPRTLFERLVWIVKDARSFIESETYVGPDRRVRSLGPPSGQAGRRAGDLPPEVGDASTPNLSQADIDAMMNPLNKTR